MSTRHLHELHDLRSLARGRLGLIIGPGTTLADPNALSDLSDGLADQFGVSGADRYLKVGARAVASGASIESVRAAIAQAFDATDANPGLSPLAKVGWSGIVSVTPDAHFETRLQTEQQWRPARRDVSVLSSPSEVARQRTTPVFKLLGAVSHRNALATTSEYLLAKARWERVALRFLEAVKASPVLVIGLESVPWIVGDFLPHLFAHHGQRPAAMVLLHGDPLLEDELFRALIPQSVVHVASGTLTAVARALAPSSSRDQLVLDYGGRDVSSGPCDIREFSDLVVSVNKSVESVARSDERERLLDNLFLPDLPSWDALVHTLDFERTISAEIEEELVKYRRDIVCDAAFQLMGSAASGKTMILKRVALNVATKGATVLWARDYRYCDSGDRFVALFKKLSRWLKDEPLYLFIDRPPTTMDVSRAMLFRLARRAGVRLLLVTSARGSETVSDSGLSSGLARQVWLLDDALDELEWSRLPAYLLQLGLAASLASAKVAVADAGRRKARDTLAVLFLLLPQTRYAISRSIREEYMALGDNEGLRELLRAQLDASPDDIRRAYGFVAVSNRHEAPLPIEVLVRALDISFGDWLEATSAQDGPAFGLLYGDDEEDAESARYRTRNDVVARTIVDTINGGVLSRHAEAGMLRSLLLACTGSNPVYSRYCCQILVPWRKIRDLDFEVGLGLYDAAISSLPYAHRTLLHHKAIWLRKKGHRPTEARRALEEALAAAGSLPHGENTDAEQHVRTSKAAAILEQIRKGEVEPRQGRQDALRELERARSSTFLNPNAVHLYSDYVAKLIGQDPNAPPADKMVAANQALAEIDRTLLLLRSSRLKRWVASYEPTLLYEVRNRLFASWVNDATLDTQARDAWEKHQVQEGMALATRRRLAIAMGRANQGAAFKKAFAYWEDSVRVVRKLAPIGAELAAVGATLYYAWQIRPRSRASLRTETPLQWKLLRDMSRAALASPRYEKDVFYRYLYGLSLAHLGEWGDSYATFAKNRSMNVHRDFMYTPHDFLLEQAGFVKRLQGRLKTGGSRPFFLADELGHDFRAETSDRWPSGKQILHAQVVFTFAGPRATLDEKACGVDV